MVKQKSTLGQWWSINKGLALVRWRVLAISVLICTASIWYTNYLIDELKDRERQSVELYAAALEQVVNAGPEADVSFFMERIIVPNEHIPVILADANRNPVDSRNLDLPAGGNQQERTAELKRQMASMAQVYEPIVVYLDEPGGRQPVNYIFYKNSYLLSQLAWYPIIQLVVIGLFGLVVFLVFNYSKVAEQNRVWAGLAKETAHQLGTPLSSLMAWADYLKGETSVPPEVVDEIGKDTMRLGVIAERFSQIGSAPNLEQHDLQQLVEETLDYLKPRLGKQVEFSIEGYTGPYWVRANKVLMVWVVENLVKNAIDAMKGQGRIHFLLDRLASGLVTMEVADTGKGMSKKLQRKVFEPGFSTKERGWGLGLTLVKRLVENYHGGKIAIKESAPGQGTTFRVVLPAYQQA